jgi:hypothetical protein
LIGYLANILLIFSLVASITFCSFSEGWFTRVSAACLSKFHAFHNTFSVIRGYYFLLATGLRRLTLHLTGSPVTNFKATIIKKFQIICKVLSCTKKNDLIIKTKSVILKKMFMDNQTIIGVSALAVFLLTYYFWLHKRKRK